MQINAVAVIGARGSVMQNRLRKRLEMIKQRARRSRDDHDATSAGVEPSGVAGTSATCDEPPCSLSDSVPGQVRVVRENEFYLIRFEGAEIAPDAPMVAERLRGLPNRETWPLPSLVFDPGPAMARRIAEERVCFLDIETTGLTPNHYLFLVGLMTLRQGQLVVEQLFARDYEEEAGVLAYVRDVMRDQPMFVTYNGAGFDMPFMQTRMVVARVPDVRPDEHVDLLEAAQRCFQDVLPDCRLETIERHLRGEGRRGDIPGRDIPDAYHEFVRTGDARKVRRILYHNRMDLLAMGYLVNHLAVLARR